MSCSRLELLFYFFLVIPRVEDELPPCSKFEYTYVMTENQAQKYEIKYRKGR